MGSLGRLPLILLLASLFTFSFAQRSAGGYGQGGGMGGGRMSGGQGGGNFPTAGEMDSMTRRPEDDNSQSIWETRTAILTPGDKVEFKLNMEAGETLMAAATSDAFDPALAIEDSKGKTLTKNDDRAEGDQSPFVTFRFTESGAYVLKVLSFHSVSGGKFTVKIRRFHALEMAVGSTNIVNQHPSESEANSRIVMRLQAKKDKIYDLRIAEAVGSTFRRGLGMLSITGPTGVGVNDFLAVPAPTLMTVFQALSDGDFYIEFDTQPSKDYHTDIRELSVVTMSTKEEKSVNMTRDDLVVFDFPVVDQQIVHTTLKGTDTQYQMSGPAGATSRITGSDLSYGNTRSWTWFKGNVDSEADIVRVFHGKGTVRIALRMVGSAPQQITLTNSENVPEWVAGKEFSGSINIGDSRLFLIKSTRSELMRVFASASHFLPRLDIFQLNGELVNSLENRVTHIATDDLYFPDEGTFLVRLTCDGNGGAGEFKMRREALAPSDYKLATSQTMKLDGENFGLFSVILESGKRYQLMTDQPSHYLRADLLDDEGHFLNSQQIIFDKVELQYFTPSHAGHYRLWLRGAPGTRRFRFELHVPPEIDR